MNAKSISIQPNKVYTYKEAQEALGITGWGFRPIMAKGLLKPQLIGKQYRFMGSELIDFVKNGK